MSNRKVTELLLQLKSAKAHGKNNIRVKPHLVRHDLRNCLLEGRDQETITRKDGRSRVTWVFVVLTVKFFKLKLKHTLINNLATGSHAAFKLARYL